MLGHSQSSLPADLSLCSEGLPGYDLWMQLENEVALSIVMYNKILFTALSALAARCLRACLQTPLGVL